MPREVRAFLLAEASRNLTSQNAEIVRAIRERMDRAVVVYERRGSAPLKS
jgi:hypothetical protein